MARRHPRAQSGKRDDPDHNVFQFVDTGPPPDLLRRKLIFDALAKVIHRKPERKQGVSYENRGTYIFTWGAGYHGELGRPFKRGHKKYSPVPQLVEYQFPAAVRQISCGGLHTAVCTEAGSVFTWGEGRDGQLGHTSKTLTTQFNPVFVELPGGVFITQVACGGVHTLALADTGQIWAWGSHKCGQLGLGQKKDKIPKPQPIPMARIKEKSLQDRFVFIEAGDNHSWALTQSGKAFSWGLNEHGQCGQGRKKGRRRGVLAPQSMRKGAKNGTGPSDEDEEEEEELAVARPPSGPGVKGKRAQTSISSDRKIVVEPKLVKGTKRQPMSGICFRQVACGAFHSVLLSDVGDVYVCGFGEHMGASGDKPSTKGSGKGSSKDASDEKKKSTHKGKNASAVANPNAAYTNFFYYPTKVKFGPVDDIVTQVASGQSHILALTRSGDVYAWGQGGYGQLGHGIKGPLSAPRLVITGKHIQQVAAGRYHSMAISSHGVMYSWGCGENGQLGQGNDENLSLPKVVESAVGTVVGQISCGEHHTAAITSAPWSKLSGDVADRVREAKEEYELTKTFVKKNNRGMRDHVGRGKKNDHKIIADKLAEWRKRDKQRKLEQKQDEAEQSKRDIKDLQGKGHLLDDIVVGDVISAATQIVQDPPKSTPSPSAAPSPKGKGDEKEHQSSTKSIPILPLIATVASVEEDTTKGGVHAHTVPARSSSAQLKLPDVIGKRGKGRVTDMMALLSPRVAMPKRSAPSGSRTARAYLPSVRKSSLAVIDASGGAVTSFKGAPQARTAFLKETAQKLQAMKDLVASKGETETKLQLIRTAELVRATRQEYDTLHDECQRKMQIFAALERENKLLKSAMKEMKGSTKDSEDYLRSLEMKFETVTIKLQETEQNRKNYEQSIAHLKEEELEHRNEIKKLQKKADDQHSLHRKVVEQQVQAIEQAAKAAAERDEFIAEIVNYRKFVEEQLAQFQLVLAKVKQHNQQREKLNDMRRSKQQSVINKRVAKLESTIEEKHQEAVQLAAKLDSLQKALHGYEIRYQHITNATGLTDPQAIIYKFQFKGEIQEQLEREMDEKTQAIKDLQQQEVSLKKELETAQADFKDARWRDVDQLEESSRTLAVKSKNKQLDFDHLTARLTHVQEGLLNMVRMVEEFVQVPMDNEYSIESGRLWTADETTELAAHFTSLCQPILDAVEDYHRKEAEALRKLEEEAARLAEEERKAKEAEDQTPFSIDVIKMMRAQQAATGDDQAPGKAPSPQAKTSTAAPEQTNADTVDI